MYCQNSKSLHATPSINEQMLAFAQTWISSHQPAFNISNVSKGDKRAPGNSLGVFASGSWYSPTALKVFLANHTDIPPEMTLLNITIDVSQIHYDQPDDSGEADLDVQMSLPLVYPQNVTIYQVDDDYYTTYGREIYWGMFQSWLNAIDGVSVILHVQCGDTFGVSLVER